MSRLSKYLEKNMIPVSRELVDRWESDIRHYGDTNIKAQVSHAKRTATTLSKAMGQFSHMSPEQELAIRAAASAMRSLAEDLAPLAKWAAKYKAFCDAERKREHAEDLERLAFERWGNDATAVQFEADLVHELGTKDGCLAFAEWLHSNGLHLDVPLEGISCCIERLGNGATLREKLADQIRENRRDSDNRWRTLHGERLIASFETYERYRAHRKDVAAKAAGILKSFT